MWHRKFCINKIDMSWDKMNNTNQTKNRGELRYSRGLRSSCSIYGTHHVKNLVTTHEWEKDRIWITVKHIMSKCQLHIVNKGQNNMSTVVHVIFTNEFYCLRGSWMHHWRWQYWNAYWFKALQILNVQYWVINNA